MRYRLTRHSGSWAVFLLAFLLQSGGSRAKGTEPFHDWSFSKEKVSAQTITSIKGNLTGRLEKQTVLSPFGLPLDGGNSIDVPGMTRGQLPTRTITAEAWISVEAGTRWGSIVGYYQDNGSYEKGWLLGYNNTNFLLSVSTASKLHTITSRTVFEKGRWYHVVGTYDGKTMKLFVNGVEEATGIAANGNIAYPEKAFYTIGAYRDADEFFRMQGVLHRVRVYNNALDSTEIKELSAKGKSIFPKGLTYSVKPHLRFGSPGSATVYWETDEPGNAVLNYGLGADLNLEVRGEVQTRSH